MTLVMNPLDELDAMRATFGPEAARRKRGLLLKCAADPMRRRRDLARYHDVLLFLAAHPDDRRGLDLVEAELRRVSAVVGRMTARSGSAFLGSGIAGSTIETLFSMTALRDLVHRCAGQIEIAWEEGSGGRSLSGLLGLCTTGVEADGFVGAGMSDEEWIAVARGDRSDSSLAWLLEQLERVGVSASVLDQLFDGAEIPVTWTLGTGSASRTFARFPDRRLVSIRRALRRDVAVPAELSRALPPARVLRRSTQDHLLGVLRDTLLVRSRETDPVTYANPRELSLFDVGRGIDVAIVGMEPARRLPLESFFGFVLARNRVPVAYGGGWVFFDRAEIGVNVFPEYRGGESAYLFTQVMRVYHQLFGVRRFLVDPYQFGADNPEAIRTGAYWFYDRLGFRPVAAAARRLADDERELRVADRAHRTSRARLRRLAEGEIELIVDGAESRRVPDVHRLACAVTQAIERRFGGRRDRAIAWASRRMRAVVPNAPTASWTDEERAAFDDLSLLFALIPDLPEWSARERRDLGTIMRAKGGVRELRYVCALQKHERLRSALLALTAPESP